MTGPRLDERELERLWAEYQATKQQPAQPAQRITRPEVRMGRESTETKATAQNVTGQRNDWIDAARQVGQGASFGFADEIEAGARAPFADRSYRDIRNDIRGTNQQFAEANPGTTAGLNVVGGVATGRALLKALQAARIAPRLSETATLLQRVGGAGRAGAAAGALGGAGAADELTDVPKQAAIGMGIGGAAGLTMAGVFEGVRAGRNVVAGLGQGSSPAGPIRRAIQAEAPEQAGTRRVLSTLGKAGQSVDDLANASRTAPQESALAELIPNNQGVRGLRISRNVGRERDAIDASLTARASDEPERWTQSLARNTGMSAPRDPKAYAEEAMKAIEGKAARLYRKAAKMPDVVDPRIAEAVETLQSMPEYGPAAIKRARTLAAARRDQFPEKFRPDGAPAAATRTEGGRLKDFAKASDGALVAEYEAITTRMQKDMGASVYNFVDSDNASGSGIIKIATATRKGGKGPSMQAKAQQRVKLSQGVLDKIEFELEKRGLDVADEMARRSMRADQSSSAQLLAALGDATVERPAVNAVPVRNVLDLRRGLDEVLGAMKADIDAGKGSPELFRQMTRIRQRVDAAAKKGGGKALRIADRVTSQAKAQGESFAQGGRVEGAGTADQIARMTREARDPEAFRQGAASKQLARSADIADGETSQPRNPVANAMGSTLRRARARAGFSDDQSFERARGDAQQIADRLKTRQAVSGNSTTAANQQEIADEFMANPAEFVKAAVSPTSAFKLFGEKAARASVQGLNASQATQMGKLYGAGLPGQMTRDQALDVLRQYAPSIYKQLQRQLVTRSAVGGAAARQLQEPAR